MEEFGCKYSNFSPQPQIIFDTKPDPVEFFGCPVEYRIQCYHFLLTVNIVEASQIDLRATDFVFVRLYTALLQDRAVQEEYRLQELKALNKN
jgi:hypothetical protein